MVYISSGTYSLILSCIGLLIWGLEKMKEICHAILVEIYWQLNQDRHFINVAKSGCDIKDFKDLPAGQVT